METDKTEPKKKKSKKVTKTAEERKAEKAAKAHANAVKVTSERLSKDITKVTDAITRIGVSENKKNTEFAVNNLKKLIADATTLLDIFDK